MQSHHLAARKLPLKSLLPASVRARSYLLPGKQSERVNEKSAEPLVRPTPRLQHSVRGTCFRVIIHGFGLVSFTSSANDHHNQRERIQAHGVVKDTRQAYVYCNGNIRGAARTCMLKQQ